MRIDFHTHLLPPGSGTGLPEEGPEALWAACAARGAEGILIQGWPFPDPGRCRAQNEAIAAALRRLAPRAWGLCAITPGREAPERAAYWLERGFSGVGELDPVTQGFSLTDRGFLALCALCQERGCLLSLRLPMAVGPGQGQGPGPADLLALLEEFPALRLLLTGFGGGLPFYGLMREVSRRLEPVWFDNTRAGLPLLPQAEEATRRCLGRDRLLWGSHLPGPDCNEGPCPEAPADWRGF